MRKIAIVLATAASAASAVTSGNAAAPPAIKSTSIAGAKRGLAAAAYKKVLGSPYRLERAKGGDPLLPGFQQPEGWTRLVFTKRKINVYFDGPVDGGETALLVTTWNKAYRTAAGIGPCSTVAQLKKAYKGKLKPSKFNTQHGNVSVYTMGDLLFAAADLTDVTAVGLYNSKAADVNKAGGTLSFAGFVIQPPDQTSC